MVEGEEGGFYEREAVKPASSATLTILSGGSALKADLFDITLQNGRVYHFTSFDVSLRAAVYPSGVQNTYVTGYTITRGDTTQQVGTDVQELELTISPDTQNTGGAPLIGGYTLPIAARLGLLDGATVTYSKLFMNIPAAGAALDTSPGAVAWFVGKIAEIDPVGRFAVIIKVACGLQYLTVQMPRNLYQAGCGHTVYDAGCTLSKATFTHTATVSSVTSNSSFVTSLTQATGYYDLGVVTFTSGANAGYSATVKSYKQAGALQVRLPFPNTVSVGDALSVYPGCDHLQATCINKFNNVIHFKGYPYVPVAETLYDGGSSNQPTSSVGKQAGGMAGSYMSGRIQPK